MELVDPMLNESVSFVKDDDFGPIFNSIMNRSRKGQPVDYVTPLVDRGNKTLSRASLRDELLDAILGRSYPWLDEIELEQAEKIGPYSIMLPFKEREEGVFKYFGPKRMDHDPVILTQAFRNMARLIQPHSLSLLDVDSAYNGMPTNTNLGLPWLTKGVESDKREVLAHAHLLVDTGYNTDLVPVYPAILFWRGQPKGLENSPKQRVIWGFPHDITVLEIRIQTPVLDALVSHPTFAAWVGQDRVNQVVTEILNSNNYPILSVDFSGFDASVPELLIRMAFDLLRLWFKEEYRRDIDFVEEVFINIPLATPVGVLTRNGGSVPSGSGVTNLIDSLIQGIAGWYAALRNGNGIAMMMVQGDDGLYSFRRPWKPEAIFEAFDELGLTASSDKGGISMDSARFLQNVHHRDHEVGGLYVGIRPLSRILNGMLSYERMSSGWNQFMDAIRWYQQIESGRYHPSFKSLVRLLLKYDRVSQNYGVREIVARAGGIGKAKSILREQSFPFGKYGLDGLEGFSTIQVLNDIKASQ